MKKLILALGLVAIASMLSSCTVTTSPNSPSYNGYTVGYGYDDGAGPYGVETFGYDSYVGYGGWASSYYSPGYRPPAKSGVYYYNYTNRGSYSSGWRR